MSGKHNSLYLYTKALALLEKAPHLGVEAGRHPVQRPVKQTPTPPNTSSNKKLYIFRATKRLKLVLGITTSTIFPHFFHLQATCAREKATHLLLLQWPSLLFCDEATCSTERATTVPLPLICLSFPPHHLPSPHMYSYLQFTCPHPSRP